MRLSLCILQNIEAIIGEWEDFAETLAPLEDANRVELRDHAMDILKVIAADLNTAKLRMMFDPVKRFAIRPTSERTLSRVQNLGLGLYVVKEIVKAHKGRVSVTSTEETGVRLSIMLPRLVPHRRDGEAACP